MSMMCLKYWSIFGNVCRKCPWRRPSNPRRSVRGFLANLPQKTFLPEDFDIARHDCPRRPTCSLGKPILNDHSDQRGRLRAQMMGRGCSLKCRRTKIWSPNEILGRYTKIDDANVQPFCIEPWISNGTISRLELLQASAISNFSMLPMWRFVHG